jgi:L-threonylcarbamoyladenylate synthase
MSSIKDGAECLKRGGIVVFPTDTVFGVGCRIGDLDAIKRLYEIRRREAGKPTLVLVSNFTDAKKFGLFESYARKLAEKFWPGPLTLVVEAKETVPNFIRGKNNTVGIRQPKFKQVEDLLGLVGEPILAPSANFAGHTPPKKFDEIDKRLLNLVDYIIELKCGGEKPSTIVEVTKKTHRIIRTGAVSKERLEESLILNREFAQK